MQHEQSLHSTDICNLPVRPNIHSTFTWYMFFVLFFSHFLNKIVYACFFPESEVRRFLFIYVSCVQNWSLDAVSLAQHTDWKGVTAILALSKVKKKKKTLTNTSKAPILTSFNWLIVSVHKQKCKNYSLWLELFLYKDQFIHPPSTFLQCLRLQCELPDTHLVNTGFWYSSYRHEGTKPIKVT